MQEQGDEMSLKHWQLDINEINNTLRLFKREHLRICISTISIFHNYYFTT